ncbi:MAG TPA: CBS domain-containing protein [Nitrospiria bacterium]|nr:CBS domain-containing protein [Nitrospiria bacterium]
MLKVKHIMSKNLMKVEGTLTIRKAVDIMLEKNIGSLIVCNDGDIIGILEERDIIKKVLGRDLNIYVTRVSEVMSVPLLIDSEETDDDASEMMNQNKVRHLAVSEDSRIIGIISVADIARPIYGGKFLWS